MSFSFVSRQMTATSTSTAIYIAPANTASIVFSGTLCNTTDSDTGTVSLSLVKANSDSSFILKDVELPYGSSIQIPKVVLEAGDRITASTDATLSGYVDVTLNIYERV